MALRKQFEKFATQRGYTIDQTILIVAVIAILITMIIASVGWDILTRASGTRVASHLKQFEQANGQFFAANAAWPHEASVNTNEDVVFRVLLGDTDSLQAPYQGDADNPPKNFLPAYSLPDGGGAVRHNFGAGGEITMGTGTLGGQTYLVIRMEGVPVSEYLAANKNIDGEDKKAADGLPDTEGRLRGATGSNSNVVDLEYYATAVN